MAVRGQKRRIFNPRSVGCYAAPSDFISTCIRWGWAPGCGKNEKRVHEVFGDSLSLCIFRCFFAQKEIFMSTSEMDAEAARDRAIAEALQASGASSLSELLADHERYKEQLDDLCAKLEALPRVIKKKTRQ